MPFDYEDLKKKELQKINAAKVRLAAISAKQRKADAREKIQLGGLLKIASEVTGVQADPATVLGGLLYVFRAIAKPEKAAMVADWTSAGQKELTVRQEARDKKKKPAAVADPIQKVAASSPESAPQG